MSPEERLTLARKVAGEKAEQLLLATKRTCAECRFSTKGDPRLTPSETKPRVFCNHVAIVEPESDHVRGELRLIPLSADKARAPDGLCGPEGVLYEPIERHRLNFPQKALFVAVSPFIASGLYFAVDGLVKSLFP